MAKTLLAGISPNTPDQQRCPTIRLGHAFVTLLDRTRDAFFGGILLAPFFVLAADFAFADALREEELEEGENFLIVPCAIAAEECIGLSCCTEMLIYLCWWVGFWWAETVQ